MYSNSSSGGGGRDVGGQITSSGGPQARQARDSFGGQSRAGVQRNESSKRPVASGGDFGVGLFFHYDF